MAPLGTSAHQRGLGVGNLGRDYARRARTPLAGVSLVESNFSRHRYVRVYGRTPQRIACESRIGPPTLVRHQRRRLRHRIGERVRHGRVPHHHLALLIFVQCVEEWGVQVACLPEGVHRSVARGI